MYAFNIYITFFCFHRSPLELEKMDDETLKSLERKAEKTAREMQKDSRHKELENVDNGQGEEEMFSAVIRNQPNIQNQNNSYPNSPRNMKPSTRGGRNNNQPPRFQNQKSRNNDDNLQSTRVPNGVGQRQAREYFLL